jgi:predicted RND superfamily exporter protein
VREQVIEFSEQILISADRKTVGIVLRLTPEKEAPVTRTETFKTVRALAAAHNPPASVAGEPLQVHDMFRYVEQDSLLLGTSSSVLLILVILILFRSFRWVALPLLVVHLSLVWTQASLYFADVPLSMVSSMLTALVTIIGISVVMHMTVTYREFRVEMDRETAFRKSTIILAEPIFWNIVTTMIGFASLLSSTVAPVRSFGLMMTVGSGMVLVASMMVLPGGTLLGRWDADPRPTPSEHQLVAALHRLTTWLDHHHWPLLIANAVVLIVGSFGLTKLTIETDFSKNFRSSSPIVQALEFFETKLGGAGNWEVNFPVPDEIDTETLDKVRKLTEELRALEMSDGTKLTKVVSLADGVDFIPWLAARTLPAKLDLLRDYQPEFVPSIYNAEQGRMRIVLRSLERQPAEIKLQLIDQVHAAAKHHFSDAKVTGLYVLLANVITSLMDDQLTSFLTSAVGIFLCVAIATRSWMVGVISLFPNLFPLVLVVGGMGWCGVPINIGTAMIASVSFGLTVDASLHYLAEYLVLRRAGRGHISAVLATHGNVGRALVFSNLALIFGFAVLALSNFIPLVYFGVLVSLAMIGGLVGNLVLLPLLLHWVPIKVEHPADEAPAASSPAKADMPASKGIRNGLTGQETVHDEN